MCQYINCTIEVLQIFGCGELTVKVGSSGREAVDDEATEEGASVAALDTEELASLRTDCASALTVPASNAAAERAAVAEKRILTQLQRIDQGDQMN